MKTATRATMIACTGLAFIAAAVYLMVGASIVAIPSLGVEQAPVVIFYIAAGCYSGGGLLVLWRRRWLWIVGLVANTLVMSIFFLAYRQEPEMMFSAAGLATKSAQILLEAGLIYLVAAGSNKTQPAHQTQPSPMELSQVQ